MRIEFNLENTVLRKGALYSGDVAVLISTALRDPIDGDVGVQWLCLCLLLLHTAGRPSTFMPGKYTDFSLTWDDIRWIPRRNSGGQTVGMDLTIRLRNFKGYGLNGTDRGAKTLHLYIRTVKNQSNLVFDIGLGLMAHAIRLGAFGASTCQDLWVSKDLKLSVNPAFINTPVLRSVAARGFGLDKTALRWSSAATAFRVLCDKAGFRGE
jgi:hypothetical protein